METFGKGREVVLITSASRSTVTTPAPVAFAWFPHSVILGGGHVELPDFVSFATQRTSASPFAGANIDRSGGGELLSLKRVPWGWFNILR